MTGFAKKEVASTLAAQPPMSMLFSPIGSPVIPSASEEPPSLLLTEAPSFRAQARNLMAASRGIITAAKRYHLRVLAIFRFARNDIDFLMWEVPRFARNDRLILEW